MVLEHLLMNAYKDSCCPVLSHMYDQHFGLERGALDPTHLQVPSRYHDRAAYLHDCAHRPDRTSVDYMVHYDKEGFRVNIDVQQFAPQDLKVKIVDNFVVVEAKHEERPDHHGGISRQFTRRYKLPEDINTQALISKLSSDGVLTIYAPKMAPMGENERTIPIHVSNVPAIPANAQTAAKNIVDKMQDHTIQ